MKKGVIFLKNAIKNGFGVVIGMSIGKIVFDVGCELFLYLIAKNESYMKRLETSDPDLYEKIKIHA